MRGLSRVVVEVVLLMVAVSTALLTVTPVGGYVMNSLSRIFGHNSLTASIINVQIDDGFMTIFIRNDGPSAISFEDVVSPDKWEIFVNNEYCDPVFIPGKTINIIESDGNGEWNKGEVVVISGITCPMALSPTNSYSIKVYGLMNLQAFYYYTGGKASGGAGGDLIIES